MTRDRERIESWLTLWRVPGVGIAHFRGLVDRFGSPAAALEAKHSELAQSGLPDAAVEAILDRPPDAAAADLAWLEQPGHHVLAWDDHRYPRQLLELADPPPVLFVAGDPEVLAIPQLAIVGSRNPTPTGRETARDFARHLAAHGLVITSGMALGVDGAAHRGALDAGGITVAVAGTGLDRVYPRQHRDLAHEILEHGALVSEFPIGIPARPEHFPRRNRIISGLSLGTLVVEAARHSGSLITARYATEQGRDVFAIPGSIHNPLARGCHQLLRDGAKLVETARDVLEELGPMVSSAPSKSPSAPAPACEAPSTDPEYRLLLECLGFEPTPIDTLVERSGLTAEAVSSMLLMLELHNEVASMTGGLYVRQIPRGVDERDGA